MPYKKYNYKNKKKYTKGNQFFSTAGKALATASTALTLARSVKSLINVETKHHNIVGTYIAPTTWTSFHTISTGILQGDTTRQRDGDSIKVKKLHMNMQLVNTGSTLAANNLRIVGIYFPTINQDLTVAADLFEVPAAFLSHSNTDYSGYRIIYDKKFTIGGDPSLAPIPSIKQFNFMWHPSNVHIKWTSNDTGGLDSNLTKGLVRFFWCQDSIPAGTGAVLALRSRLSYVDN